MPDKLAANGAPLRIGDVVVLVGVVKSLAGHGPPMDATVDFGDARGVGTNFSLQVASNHLNRLDADAGEAPPASTPGPPPETAVSPRGKPKGQAG